MVYSQLEESSDTGELGQREKGKDALVDWGKEDERKKMKGCTWISTVINSCPGFQRAQ